MLGWAVLLHFIGDYITQTNWMANNKQERWFPAILHGASYALPFLLLTQSIPALLVIFGTHVLIDHYRLARHFIAWKNAYFGPWGFKQHYDDKGKPTWWEVWTKDGIEDVHKNNGFPDSVPIWMSTWLMIITDNIIHILINFAALLWL